MLGGIDLIDIRQTFHRFLYGLGILLGIVIRYDSQHALSVLVDHIHGITLDKALFVIAHAG